MDQPLLWLGLDENEPGLFDYQQSPDVLLFGRGTALDLSTPVIYEFRGPSTHVREFDFPPVIGPMYVASPRAIRVLSGIAEGDFQPYPAVLRTRDAAVRDYQAINVLRLVSCADHDRSDWDTFENDRATVSSFRVLYPRNGCMNEFGLALEAEYRGLTYISPRVADAILSAGLTGFAAERPQDLDLSFVGKRVDWGRHYSVSRMTPAVIEALSEPWLREALLPKLRKEFKISTKGGERAMWGAARLLDRESVPLLREFALRRDLSAYTRKMALALADYIEDPPSICRRIREHDHDSMFWLVEAASILQIPGSEGAFKAALAAPVDAHCAEIIGMRPR